MFIKRTLRSRVEPALRKELIVYGVKLRPIQDMIFCQVTERDGHYQAAAEVRFAADSIDGTTSHMFWSSKQFRTRAGSTSYLRSEVHECVTVFPDLFFYLVDEVGSYIQPVEIMSHPNDLYADLSAGVSASQQTLAAKGNLRILKELLAVDGDIDSQDWAGRTAMHCAANAGQRKVVEWLLDKGADAALTDLNGDTPSDRASSMKFSDIGFILRGG